MNILNRIKKEAYYRYTQKETAEHRLRYLFLEVTRRCNLGCLHCGSDCSAEPEMREMTARTWKDIITYMKARYNPFFVLTGGEPLARKDLQGITSHLGASGADWGMVSNGFDMTEPVLNTLCTQGMQSLTLSLDGPEQQHLFLRRHPDSFSRTIEAMKAAGKSSLKWKDAVTCVYPGNLTLLHETAGILIENRMNSWRLFRIFPRGRAAKNKDLELNREQSLYLVNWIRNNRKQYRKRGLEISFSCEGYLPWQLDRQVRSEPFFCRSGISYASVLSDGTITGCNNNGPDFYQGNLRYDDFHELWENRFKEYREPDWRKTGICSDCREWKFCLGGSLHLREKHRLGPVFCYCNS